MNPHQFLPLLAVVVAFIIGLALVIRLFASRGPVSLPYERTEHLFSPAERSFLGVLEEVLEKEFCILGKVRLADIIRPRKGLSNSERTSALNRITSKHVDFAVCDLRTRAVVGVIELDDSSHQKASRQRRDEFIDKALSAAGVPIVHIAAQKGYQLAEVRSQISILFTPSENSVRS
jgi:very-short-patch-repair endonuclease